MNIALIYGGRSNEHAVSLASAKGVYSALSLLGHTLHLIAITVEGRWFLQKSEGIPSTIAREYPLTIVPGEGVFCQGESLYIDVAFAVTHGYGGEDGSLQGLCLLADLPLCGCDTLSSAIGMHKDTATKLFALEGIPTIPSICIGEEELSWLEECHDRAPSWLIGGEAQFPRWEKALQALQQQFGSALFIKPEDGGSSVGVSALPYAQVASFKHAVKEAKKQGRAVLVQPLIEPMDELECALLETAEGALIVAGPGLVVNPSKGSNHFLSYKSKYASKGGAYLTLPSTYPSLLEEKIRLYAQKAFRAIRARGYARIDFFVSQERIYLNEINTSPGMTEQSHYPLLMRHAGYSMETVLHHLIADALQRKSEQRERTFFPPED